MTSRIDQAREQLDAVEKFARKQRLAGRYVDNGLAPLLQAIRLIAEEVEHLGRSS
jgi:hypothetical protein